MATTAEGVSGRFGLRLCAYHNCDDVELFWRTSDNGARDAAIAGVLGFAIERQRKKSDGDWGAIEVLRNRVGFSAQMPDPDDKHSDASEPCTKWPFQCYYWTDHGANSGQVVRYRVSALRLPAAAPRANPPWTWWLPPTGPRQSKWGRKPARRLRPTSTAAR